VRAPEEESTPRVRWSDATLAGILVLVSALPYLNTLENGFVYDDIDQVIQNPYIVNSHHLRSILTTDVWSFTGREGMTNYYRPLMTLSYALCYRLFGKLAFGYHLFNLTLHVAVVGVLFGLTLSVFRRRDLAFLAALLFGLHPIHTESVAWVAAVTDLQLTLFFLLAFWLFLHIPRPDGSRSGWAFLGMLTCFVLALLSKEQALMLPFVATVYEHGYRVDRRSASLVKKLSRYGVLWLIAVGYLLFRIRVLGGIAPVVHVSHVTRLQALLSMNALVAEYVGKMFWPVTLCAFYVFHKASSLLDVHVLAGIGVLAASAATFAWFWKRDRRVSFAFVWFFATLAPVLNARWMAANVFAERYLYLPSVGFCWVAAWCGVRVWKVAGKRAPRVRPALAACLVLLLALCSIRIVTRNADWSNNFRLFTRTLAQQPDAWPILINIGTEYYARGDINAAKREWERALRVRLQSPVALSDLGLVYAKEKNYPQAVAYFKEAMKLKPLDTDPHLNLGVTYLEMGLPRMAEPQLKTATMLSPINTRARNELGQLYLREGNVLLAEQQFRSSIQSIPTLAALDNLGGIYLRWRRPAQAESMFLRALSINPYDSTAYFGLGAIYSHAGKTGMAIREYKAGLETDPRNQDALAALEKLQQHH
jgi:protein O-mannosyl-transferase